MNKLGFLLLNKRMRSCCFWEGDISGCVGQRYFQSVLDIVQANIDYYQTLNIKSISHFKKFYVLFTHSLRGQKRYQGLVETSLSKVLNLQAIYHLYSADCRLILIWKN